MMQPGHGDAILPASESATVNPCTGQSITLRLEVTG